MLTGLANLFKKPTESWHKAAKKNIKNLAGDKSLLHVSLKLFTNLLHQDSVKNVGVVSRYLSSSWIKLNKGAPAAEMTPILVPANSAWVCLILHLHTV